jgi:hypothetical protein
VPTLTGIVPGFLLATPALWYIGREARRQRLAPPDPAASARAVRQFAMGMIGFGIILYVVAITCYVAAQSLPTGAERAMPFDAVALGNGPPPAGQVSLAGRTDEAARVSVADGGRFISSHTTYTGFRPDSEGGKDPPFRIFVEDRIDHESRAVVPYAGREESGFLIENGLPPLIRYMLERQGVRIATPHYLLRTSSGALRDPYYVGAALGVLFGSLLIGGGTLLLVLRMRRPGTATS